ncbi:unnamed protein product, partial [Leptidea sinapis]
MLYPHPICNKFYQCYHGELVIHTCAADLFYSTVKQECDYPSQVDCGTRIIPECENDNGEGSPGGDNGGGDDNGGEGGGGAGNGECNCTPGEAPTICGKNGSDGVLIAHENCNQFYKCAHGVPVAFECYGNLLYN